MPNWILCVKYIQSSIIKKYHSTEIRNIARAKYYRYSANIRENMANSTTVHRKPRKKISPTLNNPLQKHVFLISGPPSHQISKIYDFMILDWCSIRICVLYWIKFKRLKGKIWCLAIKYPLNQAYTWHMFSYICFD